jgi:hypothetical protein
MGQLVGESARAGRQPFQDGPPADLREIRTLIEERQQQTGAIAPLADVICHTPQGIEAERDLLAAERRIGAGDKALRWSDNAWVGAEGPFDDEHSVGEERRCIGRKRALTHVIESDGFGHWQERHAGSGDSLLEIEVLVGSQAYIEAALVNGQRAIEDCTMNH